MSDERIDQMIITVIVSVWFVCCFIAIKFFGTKHILGCLVATCFMFYTYINYLREKHNLENKLHRMREKYMEITEELETIKNNK